MRAGTTLEVLEIPMTPRSRFLSLRTTHRRAHWIATALLGLSWLVGTTSQAFAQSYTRLAVPDSALAKTLTSIGSGFEPMWNELLVGWLTARVSGADSAERLGTLARKVAEADEKVLDEEKALLDKIDAGLNPEDEEAA